MDKSEEYIAYKKLIIFGAKKSGKTSITKSLENLSFSEDYDTDSGKFKNYLFIFL
jgi:GTPase SAR1 family protein